MVLVFFEYNLYLENKLLLISINFTPKTSHSCLKKGTLGFPGKFWRFMVLICFLPHLAKVQWARWRGPPEKWFV